MVATVSKLRQSTKAGRLFRCTQKNVELDSNEVILMNQKNLMICQKQYTSFLSDHTPLLLHGALDHFNNNFFRFENFWTKMEGFHEVVQTEWGKPLNTMLPIKRLHIKMARLAKGLKKWRKEKIGNTRLQLAITKEVLLQLEMAQELRPLSDQENELRKRLKARSTGLAVIEKSRMRQRSRLTYIRSGDTNTKLFHMKANTR